MLKLKYAYKNILVSMVTSYLLVRRISELFDQITMKLPDEEQFRMMGSIFIAPKEAIVNFYKNAGSKIDPGFDITVNSVIIDGNFTCTIHKKLESWLFLITIIVDKLDEKSDDYIKGLIVYKILGWSYVWKTAKEIWHEPGELKEHLMILNQRIAPSGSEEYERKVDEEAKRLGFAKELLAYDTQS